MSNRINIVPTEFVNRRSGIVTYGYRAYDDYFTVYENNWESVPDDDFDFLEDLVESCNNGESPDGVTEALEYVAENRTFLEIDGIVYEYDEISHILSKLE